MTAQVRAPAAASLTQGSAARCAHCGLPVPDSELAAGDEPQFCCSACCMAYDIIQRAGLGTYYVERAGSDDAPRPARSTGREYSEYDHPSFRQRHATRRDEASSAIELYLDGIHCAACVWLVERLPRVLPGVRAARLDLGRSALSVVFDDDVALSAIARALDRLGYPPYPSLAARKRGERERERALLMRLGVAFALAGNVMLMALALYSGATSELEYATLFRFGSLLLSIPSVFYCGAVFLRGAAAALRTRTPHMDLPISIGILAGFGRSAWNTVFAQGEIYFDSISVLIFLLLVGRWLQERHQRGAALALDAIAALAPATARLVDESGTHDVPAESLADAATVRILRDERIPVDGVVLEGRSTVDTSWLTGESLPEECGPGARVYAGTRNLADTLVVRVEQAGAATRLGRLMKSVEAAQAERAPIVRLADRVAGVFVLVALALSAVTFGVWWLIDPSRAADHAIALLVVTCPCALGMATPLAVSTALRRAARAGIFFKGGQFLEALARPGTIVFDKTGTLSEGKLSLVAFSGDESAKPYLAAAERASSHPIGRALVAALRDVQVLAVERVEEHAGGGVAARVAGSEVRVGSAAFVSATGVALPASILHALEQHAALGRPAIVATIDGRVSAVAAFSDPLRPDAEASLAELAKLGYRAAILSGDQQRVVDSVAQRLGPLVAARGGVSPEGKLRWVEAARANGPVFMVGDGVNDAAAMAAADVAFAVHGGAEASLATADAFTTAPGVEKVVAAVLGARRTLAVIRRGIVFSLAYNVVGVGLCLAGWISPLLAAVLMPLSSVTVVASALRARTFVASAANGERAP